MGRDFKRSVPAAPVRNTTPKGARYRKCASLFRSYETTIPLNGTLECQGCREKLLPDIRYSLVRQEHGQPELTIQPDLDGEERILGLAGRAGRRQSGERAIGGTERRRENRDSQQSAGNRAKQRQTGNAIPLLHRNQRKCRFGRRIRQKKQWAKTTVLFIK